VGVGPTVKRFMKEYKGKIRLIIKHYPYRYRDYARIAAEASLAARDQGKFWEMHDLMLERSPRLDRESLISYARELGLDMKKFTASIDGKKNDKEIERDLQLALKMDLYNTPTFFINGRKVVGNRPYESFKRILDEELARAGK
jgi:protein-disulfide isomerase